jgi:hypothetical protein
MKWTLWLYPAAWRQRYLDEVRGHLASEKRSLRTTLDLLAGAVDAWTNPQWIPETSPNGDVPTMITASRNGPIEILMADAKRSGAWMISITLVLTTIGVTLDKVYGDSIFFTALIVSSFFIALMISSQHTFLRPYSRPARLALMAAGSVAWYVFFVVVFAIAAR